jgi:hypothetical protein
MPYSWDLNIYRGCEHGCKYCYAIYSHDYLDTGNYFGGIYVKTNIIEQLEKIAFLGRLVDERNYNDNEFYELNVSWPVRFTGGSRIFYK